MGKDWLQTDDLNGKIESVKVSGGPLGLRCLRVTDGWENGSILPSATPAGTAGFL